MHPNPIFRPDDRDQALAMADNRGFGVLTLAGPDGVLASHVPFVREGDDLQAHLVRSNRMTRVLRKGPVTALMIVSGPDAYISPDWYQMDDQVPTWNYVAVHIRGTLRLLEDTELLAHLEAIAEHNETQLLPKKPWTYGKMTDGLMERMMRGIVPVAMSVEDVDATWKLNQNKSADARAAAADMVATSPIGQGQQEMARLMRAVEAPSD
ncbi:MAG: FMN-binding negative transcriptional regulator [Pseudomonadota bacterium]